MRAVAPSITTLVGLLSASVLWLTWQNLDVEMLRQEGSGELHLALIKANFVLVPIACLLFALAFDWASRRRFLRAALAAPALPAWSAALLFRETWLANDIWILLVTLQFQGVQPFGAAS